MNHNRLRRAAPALMLLTLLALLGALAGCAAAAPPGPTLTTTPAGPVAGPSPRPPAGSTVPPGASSPVPALPGPTAITATMGPPGNAERATLAAGAGATAGPPAAAPAMCEPTPPDELGSGYSPGAPFLNTVGHGHRLAGRILSGAGCSPIAGAVVELWLASPGGQDDNQRARVVSDAAGAYWFESSLPAAAGGEPASLHLLVHAEGFQTLVTRYYPPPGATEGTFDLVLLPHDAASVPTVQEYPVPAGSRPHDVAPAADGGVWYTAQASGKLGWLDPQTGETREVSLGAGSSPHGVIVGPAGAAWVTDGGQNAIVRVDPATDEVRVFPLPEGSGNANLNTATFDKNGILWFTGQSGLYGRLDPATGDIRVVDAPRGRGPYGITATPQGDVYLASLAGSYIARIDTESGAATVIEPPTPGQGARRVWSDSAGRIWVSEWNAGQVAVYDPAVESWRQWRLPGDHPLPYAVYVDFEDIVWLSDFGANALVRFDPEREEFTVFPLPGSAANVRQILGRPLEVWGAESGADKLVVIRTK